MIATCMEPCNELRICMNLLYIRALSGFLPNWLPFFLHARSGRAIEYPIALVPHFDFNAFGPFTFLPARVNMHGFARFF